MSGELAAFDRFFEVTEVRTPALLDKVFALRYEVYCVQNQFEDPAEHPLGRELDAYDAGSRHVALIHRASGELAGTVRLVLPGSNGSARLPIEHVLGPGFPKLAAKFDGPMGEISRYAISKQFRRRAGESEIADAGWSRSAAEDDRRFLPNLTLGLMRGVLGLSLSANVPYFCASMRPALLRLLRQFGLHFEPFGPLIEYHGLRQPCFASRQDLLAGLKRAVPECFSVVAQSSRTPPDVAPAACMRLPLNLALSEAR